MKTILLIDDDDGMLLTYGLILRRNGYHVLEAHSGVEGLQMARQYLPDLVLSDIHMPGGDGPSLLKELRKDPALKGKQVVLMTGEPEQVTHRRVMEDGADDFLLKPVSMEALLGCIHSRFDRASVNWRVEEEMLTDLRTSVPANLPHEFFTPMAGILGLMEILRSDSSLQPSDVAEIHSDVYQCALRLNRTLRNYLWILEYEGSMRDDLIGNLSGLQVEEGIHAGIEAALQLSNRREDVRLDLSPCEMGIKSSDLSHIVEELVDNSFKFSRQGTPVTIALSPTGVLRVTDKGRGMGEQDIKQFAAFQQFERKKYEQQGLGLGLNLVQKLCARYGAAFTIESKSGEGTQVTLAFAKPDLSEPAVRS